MNKESLEIREKILDYVFPNLRYGEDPDIDRYFSLRTSGRVNEALNVYKFRLKKRYPDDEKRILLLKLYRAHSPKFTILLRSLLLEQVDGIIAVLKHNIDTVVTPLEGVSMKNTYAVLKAVEKIVHSLPEDSEQAKNTAWKMQEFASLMNYKQDEMHNVAYLVGEFFDQANIGENQAVDFVASSFAYEKQKQAQIEEQNRKNFFALDKIEFDENDVKRIEISKNLTRDEDIVLAYCHKYWLKVDDPGFERIIMLYSKKYGTIHYTVFKAIKSGRKRKYSDGDILAIVSTTIATRYNYTVQGERYMQATWRYLKATLYAEKYRNEQNQINNTVKPKVVRKRVKPSTKVLLPVVQKKEEIVSAKESAPEKKQVFVSVKTTPEQKQKTDLQRVDYQKPKPVYKSEYKPSDEVKAGGSISDYIKKLSGKAYDVYKELFFSKVQSFIRAELNKSKIKGMTIYRDNLNNAENLLYEYMLANYSNAYMDWNTSSVKAKISQEGFNIDSLNNIIESCYKAVK